MTENKATQERTPQERLQEEQSDFPLLLHPQ